MGKRYFCDYCDRSFQDNLHNRKKHLNGLQHLKAKKLWYDMFRGEYCRPGGPAGGTLVSDRSDHPWGSTMGQRPSWPGLSEEPEREARAAGPWGRRALGGAVAGVLLSLQS